jgi:hypothetical protein
MLRRIEFLGFSGVPLDCFRKPKVLQKAADGNGALPRMGAAVRDFKGEGRREANVTQ